MIRTAIAVLAAAVALGASARPAQAANFVSQKRTATVYAYTYDYIWGDGQAEDSDAASTTAAGAFTPSLSAAAYFPFGGYGTAEQDSTINKAAKTFSGYGTATGGVYVQATGTPSTRGEGETTFELTFRLRKAGGLNLYAYVAGSNPGQGDDAPTVASVKVINTRTGAVVFSTAAGVGTSDEFDDVIDLAAGTYKLVAVASVKATSGAGGEVYAEGAATFDISGSVFENP